MIVVTVLTLTLFFSDPSELVQVFAPTQGLTVSIAPREGCNQIDAWWIQCWASAAYRLPVTIRYVCPTRNAVLVVKHDNNADMFVLACRWRLYAPLVPVDTRVKGWGG